MPILALLLALAGCETAITENTPPEDQPSRIVVTFPESVSPQPVTGRVLLFFSSNLEGEPRAHLNFMDPDPLFAIDVKGAKPGEPIEFHPRNFWAPDSLAFPKPLRQLEDGNYRVQALIDTDNTRRSFNDGPGNLYSEPIEVVVENGKFGTVNLVANLVIKEEKHEENDWVKLVKVRSQLLSDFHGRDVYLRASVLLPYGYEEETDRYYPAYYEVPGFGGRHFYLLKETESKGGYWKAWSTGKNPFRGFRIVLDPDMPLGHSVFANSANNGPAGDALVRELIPAIESRFRIKPESHARFIGGHSSGGWSSLWLQITYPDFFGGCWSTAPDPVDFRAYQTVNIYEDANGHWTPTGQPRPVARSRHEVLQSTVTINHWEYVLGYGEQLDSFDAVFSPRGEDGNPMQIMDKLTGFINKDVALYWKNYDIRLIIEENWPTLGPKLQGKLHIIGGGWDTFYLEPALIMLKEFLDTQDHGGYVKILPGNHGSFFSDELWHMIHLEMADQYAEADQSRP